MITRKEYLMGRDEEYPLSPTQMLNMCDLLAAINYLRAKWEKPMRVNSGYRPGRFNTAAGGAPKSPHLMCAAIDIADPDGTLAAWLYASDDLLEHVGLYMENPDYTPGWVHLQIIRPASGNRVFIPYHKGLPK